LEKFRNIWENALNSSGFRQHPFVDFDWINIYTKHFNKDLNLYINILNNRTKTIILPFCYINRGYKELNFVGGGLFDYNDIISNSIEPQEIIDGFIRSSADLIYLCRLREDSLLFSVMEIFSRNNISGKSYKAVVKEVIGSPYIDLRDKNWDSYFASLKAKFRADLLRRFKKLSALGKLEFSYCKNPEEVLRVTGKLYEQHIKRREYLGQGRSIFTKNRMRAFFEELNNVLLSKSKLFLFYLKLNDEVIAIVECFLYKNVLYHYIPTFDVRYDKYSPGRILNQQIIKFSIDNRFDELDFMVGDEGYKLEWNAKIRKIYDLFFLKNNLMGRLAMLDSSRRFFWKKMRYEISKTKLRDFRRYIFKALYKK
jgi:CelD/BcsL family acetyltransferase involved in cellulose biosynthesis